MASVEKTQVLRWKRPERPQGTPGLSLTRLACRTPRPARRPAVCDPPRHPLSPDAVQQRLTIHATTATATCPTLASKKLTPHVLRHTAAMRLLHAGIDTTVIALWLGHEQAATTQIYLHADLALKQQALARTTPTGTTPSRYQPPDAIIAFLESR
jgi:integrase